MRQINIPKNWLLISLSSLILVCSLLLTGTSTFAATKTLPPGVVIGDQTGVTATSEGDYYIDLPNVMPGETYKKDITIRSLDVDKPFELGLLVTSKESKGSTDLDQAITVTIKLDGKQLYKGNLLGDGTFDWTKQPLVIGVCEYGKDQILTAEFEVDKNLDATSLKEENQLLYYWTFVGTKNQDEITESTETTSRKGLLPMTGEEIRNWIYKILSGLLLLLIIILLWKKKRERDQK